VGPVNGDEATVLTMCGNDDKLETARLVGNAGLLLVPLARLTDKEGTGHVVGFIKPTGRGATVVCWKTTLPGAGAPALL